MMNTEEKKFNPYPRDNFLSRLFFWSAIPLFRKGMKGNLDLNDVYDCPDDDTSEEIGDSVQMKWEKELEKLKNGKDPNLIMVLMRAFCLKYCIVSFYALIYFCICHVGRAILLGDLVSRFVHTSSIWNLYLDGAGLLFLNFLGTFSSQQYYFRSSRFAMAMKTACCLLIYKKALKISQSAFSNTSVGQMVNLLSNDVNKFDEASFFLLFLVIGPIQFLIIASIAWITMGYTGLSGVALIFIYLPLQIIMGKVSASLRLKTAFLSDERINLMNDIIGQIRGIKMYGWEIPFAKLVEDTRRKEVKSIFQVHLIRGMTLVLYCLSYKIMLLISIAIFVLNVGGDLTPDIVFTCAMLFFAVRNPTIFGFTQSITCGAEIITTLNRMQKFLLLEEHSSSSKLHISDKTPKSNDCGIIMNKVEASWNKEAGSTLLNMNLHVKSGELLAIVGPVGCGKTSLLMAMLGELPIIAGETRIEGRVAFSSQEPWIFDGTFRQNITFGTVFDVSRYNAVLSACALNKDIQSFPYGDMAAVGERGVRLSGGQKARLNLARAIYFDADIYLLDDPLSAVDSSVSKHLFDRCIDGFLKDKIRILVTHQLQYLRRASKILVMENGTCAAIGTYQQLIDDGVELSSYLADDNRQMEQFPSKSTGSDIYRDNEILNGNYEDFYSELKFSSNASMNENSKEAIKHCDVTPKSIKESEFSESVKLNVYREYIKASAGVLFVTFVLLSQLISQFFMNGTDFWLTNWSTLEQIKHNTRDCWRNLSTATLNMTATYNSNIRPNNLIDHLPDSEDVCYSLTENYTISVNDVLGNINEEYQLWVYGGLLLIVILLYIIRVSSFYKMCMVSSCTLHDKLFWSILRSPISFFDKIPVGNILNRISQDMGFIDEVLPFSGILIVEILSDILGIITVTLIAEPYLIFPAMMFVFFNIYLFLIYLPSAKNLNRFHGISKSPIFSLLSSSLNGLTTIRNLKMQNLLTKLFQQHQNKHTSTFIAFILCVHCFSTFIDIFCNLYSACVTVAMILLSGDPLLAARAGLAVSMSLQLCVRVQFCVKRMSDMENQMTSVERVLVYSNLKSEADLESKTEKRPPKNWPLKGHIVYKNVYFRYYPNHAPVLKGLSFEIYPGEKIGIVGRTGAGKSSLISSLFRLTEPEGIIEIDDVSTMDIGLHDLRKRITIIPQDPILFTGTVRRNLDPFGEHKDSELWQALEAAFLKQYVQVLPEGLDAKVSEKGSNFSVGQRQLICLARAILRKNRILVLDEATANVDLNTDRLIQLVIRRRFANCTILIIAHRLHTIMDTDRVLVMESGEIKEFDTPYNLLRNPNGIFSHMLKMTGSVMSRQLKNIATATRMRRLVEDRIVIDLNRKKQVVDDLDTVTVQVLNENNINGYVNKSYDDTESSHI